MTRKTFKIWIESTKKATTGDIIPIVALPITICVGSLLEQMNYH